MKRSWLAFCLSLLLVLAQQEAVLHELSHLAGDLSHSSQQKQLPQDKLCDQCVAYAGLGHGAVGSALPPVLQDACCHLAALAPDGRFSADSVPYSSRAPPFVLA